MFRMIDIEYLEINLGIVKGTELPRRWHVTDSTAWKLGNSV